MNWKLKAAIQATIAPLPFAEDINHFFQVARGAFGPKQIAHELEQMLGIIATINSLKPLRGATVVEIGSGWDARHPLLFALAGADRTHSFDLRRLLNLRHCRDAARFLGSYHSEAIANALGSDRAYVERYLSDLAAEPSLESFLEFIHMSYHAPVDASKTGLPSSSVDIVFSYAVLEHVAPSALSAILVESRRVLKPGGISYHMIGPGDHYAGMGANVTHIHFLKYSPSAWNRIAGNRLAYHNRLRPSQFREMFTAHGAEVLRLSSKSDPEDVEALRHGFPLHRSFRELSLAPEDLAAWETEAIFRFV